MSPLRSLLKGNTAAAHGELERLPMVRFLLDGSLSAAQYGEYLCLHHQLYAPLESSLRCWVSPDWQTQRLVKTDWLESDIASLGLACPSSPAQVPLMATYSHALGVMYVLEGSTLGSQIIRARLEVQGSHLELRGADRFLCGYKQQTGPQWRGFLEALEALPTSQWPLASEAALSTFAAFHSHLSRFADVF